MNCNSILQSAWNLFHIVFICNVINAVFVDSFLNALWLVFSEKTYWSWLSLHFSKTLWILILFPKWLLSLLIKTVSTHLIHLFSIQSFISLKKYVFSFFFFFIFLFGLTEWKDFLKSICVLKPFLLDGQSRFWELCSHSIPEDTISSYHLQSPIWEH